MKKVIALCLSAILIICAFCACGSITQDKATPEETTPPAAEENTAPEETTLPTTEENTETGSAQDVATLPETNYFTEKIKESPDKYTWYIKNYVGRNCATIGSYSEIFGYIIEQYGKGYIHIIMITEDGSFVTEDTISDYVVIEQSVAPNTELKYVFGPHIDPDGVEHEIIQSQNIEEMEVLVRRVEGAQSPSE